MTPDELLQAANELKVAVKVCDHCRHRADIEQRFDRLARTDPIVYAAAVRRMTLKEAVVYLAENKAELVERLAKVHRMTPFRFEPGGP